MTKRQPKLSLCARLKKRNHGIVMFRSWPWPRAAHSWQQLRAVPFYTTWPSLASWRSVGLLGPNGEGKTTLL